MRLVWFRCFALVVIFVAVLAQAFVAEAGYSEPNCEVDMSDRVTDTFKDSFRDTVIGWFADGASDRADALRRAEECAEHGCESGCVSEAIYYSDNARTYERFEAEILDLCNETGWSDRGEAGDLGTICQIMNDRVWVAVESVACELSEDSFEDYFPDEDSDDEDSDDEDSDDDEDEFHEASIKRTEGK